MATEQYSIGYEEGFQNGWNAAVDAKPEQPAQHPKAKAIAECLAVLRPSVKGKFPHEQALEELVGYIAAPQPAQQEPVAWQLIETAPQDGTKILGWNEEFGARETQMNFYGEGSIGFAAWKSGKGSKESGWDWSEPKNNGGFTWRPTHWMPLLTPFNTSPLAQRPRVVFPTMLRKMWSGSEVQAWLDETVNK